MKELMLVTTHSFEINYKKEAPSPPLSTMKLIDMNRDNWITIIVFFYSNIVNTGTIKNIKLGTYYAACFTVVSRLVI